VNHELERVWKEAVVVCFKILSQYFPGRITGNYEQTKLISRPGFEAGTTVYNSEAIMCEPTCSVQGHFVTQKATTSIFTAVRTSNLSINFLSLFV
jgi:hypothetical protein